MELQRRPSPGRSPRRAGALAALALVTAARIIITLPAAARAADPPGSADHERRIKELEDTVRQLRSEPRPRERPAENPQALAGWADGFTLASPDGTYTLRIGAFTHADGRYFVDDTNNALTNQLLFRRVRLDLSGTVFKHFDFRIVPDFSGNPPVLFDAYVEVTYIPHAKLRIGKFRPPVGLERLQSGNALLFVERGLPSNIVPNRDVGAQLFGDFANGALAYQVAVVNGAPDGSVPTGGDVNDDKDFDGRIFAVPFKDGPLAPLKGLGVGVAGGVGRQRGRASAPDLPSFRTFGQADFFVYRAAVAADPTKTPPLAAQGPTIAFGQRARYAPQASYYWGPFGLLAEYVRSTQSVKRDAAVASLHHEAWSAGASYVLTGDAASYRGVTPAQPFAPFEGHWGAFEVAARYGQLDVDPDAFAQGFADPKTSARRATEWVVGVNWYLNKHMRLMLDYANTEFRGGAATGDRPAEKAILSRVQLLI